MEWGTILRYIGIPFAAIIVCFFGYLLLKRIIDGNRLKREAFVRRNSRKVRSVQALNERYEFEAIPQEIPLKKECRSKQEYDRANLREFLI